MPRPTTGHKADALKWHARIVPKSDPTAVYDYLQEADSYRRFPIKWTEQWENYTYVLGPQYWTEQWNFTGYDVGNQQWLEQWAFSNYQVNTQQWNELWDFFGYDVGSQQWLELWAFTGYALGPQEWLEQWSFTEYVPFTLQWTETWQFNEYFPNQLQWLEQWTEVPYSYEGTGGITLLGNGGTSYSPRLYTGTGGVTLTGAATTSLISSNIYTYIGTGSLIASGTASTSETDSYTGSGGLITGGAATTSKTTAYSYTGTGILVSNGAGAITKTKALTATGGLVTGGIGETSVTPRYYDGSGGITFGGVATTQYIAGTQVEPIDLLNTGIGTDNSGTNNNAAYIGYEVSPAVQTAGTPKVTQTKINFVSTGNTFWTFNYQIPAEYTSGGTLRGKFKMASATTGNVEWRAGQVSTIDLSTNDNSLAFAASDTTGSVSVPGTLGHVKEFTITLTTTNMLANRKMALFIGRDTSVGSNATGDAELVSLAFEFS